MSSGSPRDVQAAGVVVFGRRGSVLLVHRPKYDDWSFPKGKLDPGERATTAAVREVEEETGLRVRLGPPLGGQRYPVREGMKTVHYWTGRVVGDPDVSGYAPNAEIDDVAWVGVDEAARVLTYERDVATLHEALDLPRKTRTVVVLRHAVARSKRSWSRKDSRRPLVAAGERQAERLVPVLAAYDVRTLVSSSSTRCVQTLDPYSRESAAPIEELDGLTEESATRSGVRRLVRDRVQAVDDAPARAGGLVLCTHRPVLPWVFEALELADPGLEKGEFLVAHRRKGVVVATERHRAG
ncbi:NUDIX hydrolase [Nocardioides halotolerans]|jgi:8-oxo-dGTP diphosphatase|uniref:NUDIX hydrolase n=1 Tax=Nocardioides halotolerans TaxID=433660 RepID=UPI000416AAFF|nr:NUDIX hydrolase [Nocardioides halotolerans]